MELIVGRNVNDLYARGIERIRVLGRDQPSRAGDVIAAQMPVTSVYVHPEERVLLDPKRRANPFFHLMEALWMLNGNNDATFLDWYVHDFSSRFAEGGIQWGAYGFRWREHFAMDQLDVVVDALSADPYDRRVVISMWDPESDLGRSVKDVPCNTHVYPRIVNGKLDLTVCCRSNDIIWGAYGANAVHFSVLQEYLAGRIGVPMGILYQISNNWHAYTNVLDKFAPVGYTALSDGYQMGLVASTPIGTRWDVWDDDLDKFMDFHNKLVATEDHRDLPLHKFQNAWFRQVAVPMAHTWWLHKKKKHDLARLEAAEVKASDWRMAAMMWLEGVKES